MTKIFFTSDIHFGHVNIMRPDYANRPFKDVSHMNEELVKGWNSVVGQEDVVYFLGDMLMGRIEESGQYLKRLNGIVHCVHGNHDQKALKYEWFRNRFATIQDRLTIEHDGKKIALLHYFNHELAATHDLMFHGHSHTQGRSTNSRNSLDIGVDAAAALLGSYRPFTIEEAISFCA